ncbi:hypothetical protein BGI41_04540 [Methanobrevibacter sp. 87.7]|uniref:hypothetical protein n=1 Tax=Methanobrevibacter sp. 87.7 TaxID=387957 RepID=UPI000B510481|nr:hypothetical protein [Methanobrevibacter sp. 87.7]OWT33036.1 hypothetical protein BGI41_04540 [Methanobrevibacter sp. 87.7]
MLISKHNLVNYISILVLCLIFLISPIYGECNTNLTNSELNFNIGTETFNINEENNNESLNKHHDKHVTDIPNEDPHNRKRIRRLER